MESELIMKIPSTVDFGDTVEVVNKPGKFLYLGDSKKDNLIVLFSRISTTELVDELKMRNDALEDKVDYLENNFREDP